MSHTLLGFAGRVNDRAASCVDFLHVIRCFGSLSPLRVLTLGAGVKATQQLLRMLATLGRLIKASTRGQAPAAPLAAPRRAVRRQATTWGDVGHSLTPWGVGGAAAALLQDTAPWSGLPAVLGALVRRYLDGDWVVLLSKEGVHGLVSVYTTSSVERWDELPAVADLRTAAADRLASTPATSEASLVAEAKMAAEIAEETAAAEERFAVKGPWTRLRDLSTPRALVDAVVCVGGELLVYGGKEVVKGVPHRYVDATDRLSLRTGEWRTASHAGDGTEYAAAYATLGKWGPGLGMRPHPSAVVITRRPPHSAGVDECVQLHYTKAHYLSFGESRGARPVAAATQARAAAVTAALASWPRAGFLTIACRLDRADGRSGHGGGATTTSLLGVLPGDFRKVPDVYLHHVLDERTGRCTVATPPSTGPFGCAVALPSGELLLVDGGSAAPAAAEIYSPATDSWRRARWTVPNDIATDTYISAALIADGLLHLLVSHHILIARLDPTDAAAPCEWRVMRLPYGMRKGNLARVTPSHYTAC